MSGVSTATKWLGLAAGRPTCGWHAAAGFATEWLGVTAGRSTSGPAVDTRPEG